MLFIITWTLLFISKCYDSPVQKMEEERIAHEQKLAKMEAEMRSIFQAKVTEKEQKLKQSEEEVIITWIDTSAVLLNPEHVIVVCTPQGDEGGTRKAAFRSGRKETSLGKWKTHYTRESQKERLLLQQVIISIPFIFFLSFHSSINLLS